MATGALDANGIWQYGEDDSEPTFSGMLNKLASSTSTTVTRLEELSGLTAAQLTTHRDNLGVGLVNVVPASVAQAGGSASANAQGLVSYTGVTSVSLNNVFTSAYDSYRIMLRNTAATASGDINFRLRNGGVDNTTNNYSRQIFLVRLNGTTASAGNAGINYFPLSAVAAGSNVGYLNMDLHGASQTAAKSINQIAYSNDATGSYTAISSCLVAVTTTTDGFTLSASAGNISGTVQVFGYNN